jgi:YggT family protein
MLLQIAQLLIETISGFFVFLLLLRFYMQLFRAPFRNAVGEFITTLTNWMVLPVRRIIPGLFGLDLASLLLVWLVEAAMLFLLYAMRGMSLGAMPGAAGALVLVIAAVELVRFSIYLLIGVVLLQVVLSWVSPYNLLSDVLESLTRPFYRIFRRFIPPIGAIDLSPLFVLLAAQILLIVLNGLTRSIYGVF